MSLILSSLNFKAVAAVGTANFFRYKDASTSQEVRLSADKKRALATYAFKNNRMVLGFEDRTPNYMGAHIDIVTNTIVTTSEIDALIAEASVILGLNLVFDAVYEVTDVTVAAFTYTYTLPRYKTFVDVDTFIASIISSSPFIFDAVYNRDERHVVIVTRALELISLIDFYVNDSLIASGGLAEA